MGTNKVGRLLGAVSIVALLGLLATGCGSDITITEPASSVELIRRAREFLSIASMLAVEGRHFWGQSLRNAYYASLTLARFKDRGFYGEPGEKYHQTVWSQAPKAARKYFRDELRRLRVKYDYQFTWPRDETPEHDLREFAQLAPNAFDALVADVEKMAERRMRGCALLHGERVEECLVCRRATCERDELFSELEGLKAQLGALFLVQLPAALDLERPTQGSV